MTTTTSDTERTKQFWREPQHANAALEENWGGVGLGVAAIIIAASIPIAAAWYLWPLPLLAWLGMIVLAGFLAGGGAWNIVRFTHETRHDLHWAANLEREKEHMRLHIDGLLIEREQLLIERRGDQKTLEQLEQECSWLRYRLQKVEGGRNHVTRQDATPPSLRNDVRALVDFWTRTGRYPSRERVMAEGSGVELSKRQWENAIYELRKAGVIPDGPPPTTPPNRDHALHKLSVRWSVEPSVPSVRPDDSRGDDFGRTDPEEEGE